MVELEGVSDEQWAEIIGGEVEPWGGGIGERMRWRGKESYRGVRSWDGTLVALAGVALACVDVGGGDSFEVLGIGGVFAVRASADGGSRSSSCSSS